MKTLLVTGYRAHELGIYDSKHQGIPYIKKALANRLAPLIEEGWSGLLLPANTASIYGLARWCLS